MSQRKQQKQTSTQSHKLKQFRYRKLTLAGGNTIVTYNNVAKVRQKNTVMEFPLIDIEDNNNYNISGPPIDSKIYEQQLYKKNNYRAMKALIKAYEENKKKNSNQTMNMLGLDIKKLQCFPQQSRSALNKKSQTKLHNHKSKSRHNTPKNRINKSSRSDIIHKKSENSADECSEHQYAQKIFNVNFYGRNCSNSSQNQLQKKDEYVCHNYSNQQNVVTLTNSPTKISKKSYEAGYSSLKQNIIANSNKYSPIKYSAQNTTPQFNLLQKVQGIGQYFSNADIAHYRIEQEQSADNHNMSNFSIKQQSSDIDNNSYRHTNKLGKTYFCRNNTNDKQDHSSNINNINTNTNNKSCKKHSSISKKQQYLYEKLANKQLFVKEQLNLVYQRRIKSYLDFLFKLQYAHNIYNNLDLRSQQLSAKGRRVKYFIGPGNNSTMVRCLLKRRYWWQPSDDIRQCCFVWTQTKVNQLYSKQRTSDIPFQTHTKFIKHKASQNKQQNLPQQITADSFKKTTSGISDSRELSANNSNISITGNMHKNRSLSPNKVNNDRQSKKMHTNQQFNYKILSEADIQSYHKYYQKYELDKNRSYLFKMEKCMKVLNQHKKIQDSIVHNHLPHNYNLGNKKALFYNLQQYYTLINQNPFDYLPLTFHIKNGFKDDQYKRFLTFYNRRKNQIKKQIKQMQQQYGEGYQGKKKTRNIWIVKPGQNSNQGRGITVIDQIYELNNIMKRVGESKGGSLSQKLDDKDKDVNGNGNSGNSGSHNDNNNSISGSHNNNNNNKQLDNHKQTKRTYIVQMYIDRPMLYNNRKFDIRHYMLVTNLYGVNRMYWYQEGYIRTSSYQFRIDNFDPQIHLTNDFIQKKYPQYGKYQPCNKISYEQFQRYLDANSGGKKYSFKSDVLPKMKKMGTDAAKSVFLKLSPNNIQHNFQIFGLDFMIDRHFQPWLIEINTNPCLECNCPLLDRIIPYMVEQSLKLSLDVVYPPPSQYPNTNKHYAPMMNLQNFKYELIFDEHTDGDQIRRLYGVAQRKNGNNGSNCKNKNKTKLNNLKDLGQLDDDQWFGDDGKQIKLDDFT